METITGYKLIFFSLSWAMLSSALSMLCLSWALAQLGWILGPSTIFLFSIITYFTSNLLFTCCAVENYNYDNAVRVHLGDSKLKIYKICKYVNRYGAAIGSILITSTSIMAIKRSFCLYKSEGNRNDPCHISKILFVILFVLGEIVLSQFRQLDKIWWVSTFTAIMSCTYSTIGLVLGLNKIMENRIIKGNITGIYVPMTFKVGTDFTALGNIAFSYSYFMTLVQIQDKIKSPPSESKTIKNITLISIIVTTAFYMICGCVGYAAFGEHSSGNLLTDFDLGLRNPLWILGVANAAIIMHLGGAFQIFSQPIYSAVEKKAAKSFPDNEFLNHEIQIPISSKDSRLTVNIFRFIWRSAFVIIAIIMSLLVPFLNDIIGLIGAVMFWPLTVYFPVEIYMTQERLPKWSAKRIFLHVLSASSLVISLMVAIVCLVNVIYAISQ